MTDTTPEFKMPEKAELLSEIGEFLTGDHTPREGALILAIWKHGLANLADGSVPAGDGAIIRTANVFHRWLSGEYAEER